MCMLLFTFATGESLPEEPETVELMEHGHEENSILWTQRYVSSSRWGSGKPFDLGLCTVQRKSYAFLHNESHFTYVTG